jgi:hypothetical protein
VRLPVLLAVYTKYLCHFRFSSVLLGKIPLVSFFHWHALLFFVKIVKRAFELGDPLGYEVKIE